MTELTRTSRTRADDPQNLPVDAGDADLVLVDTTWGVLQPMQPVSGVQTVGELEVTELLARGALLVDTRVPDSRSGRTLPGAVNIPHDQILDRQGELSATGTSVLFCNGPQCPQTPDALAALKQAGYPLERLAYYRGGMHDWITLAMPTAAV
jgi:rhodanese-related sulfurtransferase